MKYLEIKQKYPQIRLIAVSKYTSDENILSLHRHGQIEFGENKVQDLARKNDELSSEIKWHFIGNLQKNKANALIRCKPAMWQSCTSFELAKFVDERLSYPLETLVEINCADEESKAGCPKEKAAEIFMRIQNECKFLKPIGVMCIGALSSDVKKIEKSFKDCRKIYEELVPFGAKICSMGMSSDYEIAIANGSNMIRLGSILFNDL